VCIGWAAAAARAPRRAHHHGSRSTAIARPPPHDRRHQHGAGPRRHHPVEQRQGRRGAGEHEELSQLDTQIEAEQRQHDRPFETLEVVGEAGAVHQPEPPASSRYRRPHGAAARSTAMFSTPVTTMVSGWLDQRVGSVTAPLPASASVTSDRR
jgi:hypothetical protein